jgi:hypothetical protein
MVLTLFAALAAVAEPRHGLMWQRTGLPAVFPLQIKTHAGADYYLLLTAAESGEKALAAYVTGGQFFRVLVPPGTYDVQLATGTAWQDETALFGPETAFIHLPEPLTFEVQGVGTKAGHLIDLTTTAETELVRDNYICQRQVQTHPPRPQPPYDDRDGYATRLTDRGDVVQYPDSATRDRLAAGVESPAVPNDFDPYWSQPRYDVRDRPCY